MEEGQRRIIKDNHDTLIARHNKLKIQFNFGFIGRYTIIIHCCGSIWCVPRDQHTTSPEIGKHCIPPSKAYNCPWRRESGWIEKYKEKRVIHIED